MIGEFCYLLTVGPIEAELHIPKVEKLDACIRPLFTNSVTFVTESERTHLPRTQQEDTLFTITR